MPEAKPRNSHTSHSIEVGASTHTTHERVGRVCSRGVAVVQGRADNYRVYHRVIPVASPAARGPPLALGPSPAPACDRSLSRAPYLPAPQPPGPLLPPSLLDFNTCPPTLPQRGGSRFPGVPTSSISSSSPGLGAR